MEKEGTNKPEGALKGLLKIIVIALAVYGAMSLFGVGSSRQGNLGQRPPQGQYDPAEGWGPEAYQEPPGPKNGMLEGYEK